MIEQPGIYTISAPEYHQDPCPEPSLSASLIDTLLSYSPLHARQEHPKLNPYLKREESERFDRGAAAHAFLLEGHSAFEIIDHDDFRTKAAREQRDVARAAGKTPLLRKHWQDVMEMAEAANRQLDEFRDPPRPLSNGKPEQSLIWKEGDVWARARADWLHDDYATVDDYKSTAASANPEAWTRTLYGMGADIQVAWYRRGIKAVTGIEPLFRFVVQENYPPFALSVVSLGPMAMALAEKKILFAIDQWSECLRTNHFPGYPTRTAYADLPAYEEARWLAKEEAA